MVWANSLVKEPDLPSVLDYGWTPLLSAIARSLTAQRTVLAGRQEKSAQLFVVAIVITEPVDN